MSNYTYPQYQQRPPRKGMNGWAIAAIAGGIPAALVSITMCTSSLAGSAPEPASPTQAASAPAQPAPKTQQAQPQQPKAQPKPAQPKPAQPKPAEVVQVSAGKLIEAFEDNELKADQKYKGRTLEVTGVVKEIDTELFDEDKYILRVGTGDEWEYLSVDFYDMPVDVLDDLDTDDKVTVVGEFDDGGDLGVIIRNGHLKS